MPLFAQFLMFLNEKVHKADVRFWFANENLAGTEYFQNVIRRNDMLMNHYAKCAVDFGREFWS